MEAVLIRRKLYVYMFLFLVLSQLLIILAAPHGLTAILGNFFNLLLKFGRKTFQSLFQPSFILPPCPENTYNSTKLIMASIVPSLSTSQLRSEGVLNGLRNDGFYTPEYCTPFEEKVAVIIPFRNRPDQLNTFLGYIIQFLKMQKTSFQVFVVEQIDTLPFNRASLLNVGFLEAVKEGFSCFIFHDVDHLPENPGLTYTCHPEGPVHFSVAVSKFNYRLPYATFFGGVTAFTREQFDKVNGFSNCYWGWGAEDDDIYRRATVLQNYTVYRPPDELGRYFAIKHKQETENPQKDKILQRFRHRVEHDGINSVVYDLRAKIPEESHTKIKVRLHRETIFC